MNIKIQLQIISVNILIFFYTILLAIFKKIVNNILDLFGDKEMNNNCNFENEQEY